MNIDLRYINLYWELDAAIQEYKKSGMVDFSEINLEVEELIAGAESCLEMINNRRKMPDVVFYKKLLKFAYINSFNDFDYQHIIELMLNTKFSGQATILTTMHDSILKQEGHGRSFDSWFEEIGINLKIFYTEDANINRNHIYSITEIKSLLAEGKIAILYESERQLDYENEDYVKEEYQEFECTGDKIFVNSGKHNPYMLKYIRSHISTKQLLKLFKDHLQHVNSEINYVTDRKNYELDSFKSSVIASEYCDEFKEKGYAKRLAKLNNMKLNLKK